MKSPIDLASLPRTHLLNDSETASALGLSAATLSVWRCVGRYDLPYRKIGRNVRYSVGDILDFLERRSRVHVGAED